MAYRCVVEGKKKFVLASKVDMNPAVFLKLNEEVMK
jgi:hypothetical protein